MSREELVEAYLDGKISRRIFIRRLVAAGVSLGAAAAYSDLLMGSAAAVTPKASPNEHPPPPDNEHNPPGDPNDHEPPVYPDGEHNPPSDKHDHEPPPEHGGGPPGAPVNPSTPGPTPKTKKTKPPKPPKTTGGTKGGRRFGSVLRKPRGQ
jgi:hypothetical protein